MELSGPKLKKRLYFRSNLQSPERQIYYTSPKGVMNKFF